jgi:hypothetical protein
MDETEQVIYAKIRRSVSNNDILAGNLWQLFSDFTKDGQAALNEVDKFDLDSVLDAGLGYYEHRARIKEMLGGLGYVSEKEARLDNYRKMLDEAKIEVGKDEESAQKAASEVQSEATRASFDAGLARLAAGTTDTDELIAEKIPAFRSMFEFIDLLLGDSEYTQGAIIYGDAGVGKTHGLCKRLAKRGMPYALFNSYSTPLAFYELLFRNNGKLVILDDVNTLLHDPKAVAIMKAGLFSAGGARLITYSSTAKVLEERGIPGSFIFTGRIVILLNEIPQTIRETFQALLSRVYSHEVKLSLQEKKDLVRIVFEGSEVFGLVRQQKMVVLNLLTGCLDFSNAHRFNVRTALRAAEIYKKLGEDRATQLIYDLMDVDLRLRQFLLIENNCPGPTEKKVELWIKTTGYSRRDYFNVKARYYLSTYGKKGARREEESEMKKLTDFGA